MILVSPQYVVDANQRRKSVLLPVAQWPAVIAADDSVATWPSLPKVKECVKKGIPPQDDFVPAGLAGLNHGSLGYMNR
jgi:hypothetical protein